MKLCRKCKEAMPLMAQEGLKMVIKLYYHKTSRGAEYLMNTFIKCKNSHKEGVITDKTKYVVRIDGDITKDAVLLIREKI